MRHAAPVRGWRGVEDAVEHRVAQVDVARFHVDPGAQHARPLVERARPHPTQEVEVFGGRAVAPGTFGSGFGQRPPHRADLVGARIVDIGLPFAHQMLGPFVEPLEMVGREVQVLAPVVAEPADVGLDGVDERGLFLDRIGVVEAEMAAPAELTGDPEIEHDRLGVADMEVAVGLGREAGDHLVGAPGRNVLADDGANEIARRLVALRLGDRHGAERSGGTIWRRPRSIEKTKAVTPDLFRGPRMSGETGARGSGPRNKSGGDSLGFGHGAGFPSAVGEKSGV